MLPQQSTLTLNGTGTNIAIVNGTAANFGTVPITQTQDATVTFTNSGSLAATSFAINNSSVTAPFSIQSNNCGSTLAAGGSCSLDIRFSPVTTGAASGVVTANFYSGVTSTSATASLTGTGSIGITITATNASFGSVPIQSSSNMTVTITNSGTRTATSFAINNGSVSAPFSVVSTTCSSTLAGGASCAVVVQFSPTNRILQRYIDWQLLHRACNGEFLKLTFRNRLVRHQHQ